MSTSVTRERPVAGPGTGLGLAAAGLAIVVAIGIGFTLSEGNAALSSDVQPAHPQVSDSRRVKAEIIAKRDAASPGANVEAHKVVQGMVGGETEAYSPEERRVRVAKAQTSHARRDPSHVELQEPGPKTWKGEVAGS